MSSDIVREIERLDALRREAMVSRNLDVLEDLLSEHLVYVHNNSEAEGKRSYIDRIRTGLYHYLDVTQPEAHVRLVGDTALITGRTVLKVKLPDGGTKTVDGTTVTVWARDGGKWRMEYYQGTPRPVAV